MVGVSSLTRGNLLATTAHSSAATAAAYAGLRWINDDVPGLRRSTERGKAVYRTPAGRIVRDPIELARIGKLAIPPAWQDVWICPAADGHLQTTGRDARGRKQYRYHADWQAHRNHTKFDALKRFGEALPRIRARLQRELAGVAVRDVPTRARVLATLVYLLDVTSLRIGNAEYARTNGSFGLSTLRNRHARVQGDEVQLSFVGKSGVRHQVRLSDRRVARIVMRCSELPGQELFQYVDEQDVVRRIDSAEVNEWLAETTGARITAKDFRTWHGSLHALALIMAACADGAEACRARDVLNGVAHRLGNTPAVCKKAYVHPRVLALCDTLSDEGARAALRAEPWARPTPTAQRGRGLSADEHRLLALLRSRARAT
jgi:DNA topoisomerase-1